MAKRETTDYIVLMVSRIGRSEPENLREIEKIKEDICNQFTGKWQTVEEYSGPAYSYQYPVTETLEE